MKAEWRTEARREALEVLHARGASGPEILAALAAMDGPPVPADAVNVRQWIKALGLAPLVWRHPWQKIGECAQRRGVAAARARAAASAPAAVAVTWGEALAWAAGVDPDMVLRGDRANRLQQINELRRIEGRREFVLASEAIAA